MIKHLLAKALVFILFLFQGFNFTISLSPNFTGFSLKLIPRDSPESPIYFGNLTFAQKIEKMVDITHARAQYLKHRATPWLLNSSSVTQPQQGGQMQVYLDGIYYTTQLMIGTPSVNVYLLMDTAGTLTWTQCLPCVNCYPQAVPLYNSQTSTTYSKLACSHDFCNGGPISIFQCENDQCPYTVAYTTGAFGPTKGVASMEKIGFITSAGTIQFLGGIMFGCLNDNVNFPTLANSNISGIMGLSLANESIVTQLSQFSNGRFSHCLVPFDEARPVPSSLTFGDAIPTPKGIVQTARFVPHPLPFDHYFYLALLDISVGWTRLGFPLGMFDFYDGGKGGFFIDTGALFTLLKSADMMVDGKNVRNVYKEVIVSFASHYDGEGLRRSDAPNFELCYHMPSDNFKGYLNMTYHFDGSDYVVDSRFVHYFNRDAGFFCVSLMKIDGVSILGSWHQQNVRITYDANIGAIQYSQEYCN